MANEDKKNQDPLRQDNEGFSDQPSSTEGPQFGLNNKESWLSKYGSSIILPIVAILILAGGIYLYATQKEEETTLSLNEEPAILDEEIIDLNEEEVMPEEGPTDLEEEVVPEEEEKAEEITIEEIVPETKREDGTIVVKSGSGDGITHLARQAVQDYLRDHSQEGLSNEHKVYIEDYIQNRTGARYLEIGEEIIFSESLIKEAIDASLQLTSEQLTNLEKYSGLVVWQD